MFGIILTHSDKKNSSDSDLNGSGLYQADSGGKLKRFASSPDHARRDGCIINLLGFQLLNTPAFTALGVFLLDRAACLHEITWDASGRLRNVFMDNQAVESL